MIVALTGGSGVVGGAVLRHLIAAGHRVRALARSDQSAASLTAAGAEVRRGDVLDSASLEDLFAGADLVFHVAGVNQMCSPDPDVMDRVNIEGTRNVLAALRRGGARLVHTSSAAAIGEPFGVVANEDTVHRGRYLSRYERSKHLSEREVLTSGLDVVVVNPSSVQGPGRETGTARMLADVVSGRLRLLVDTRFSIVDIEDCGRGHLFAAERGRSGARYLLSGGTVTVRQAMQMVEDATGRVVESYFLPGWVASSAAAVTEAVARMAGRSPTVCREMVRVLRHGHAYDGSRATVDLGLEYTPLEDTVRRTLAWFAARGLLH